MKYYLVFFDDEQNVVDIASYATLEQMENDKVIYSHRLRQNTLLNRNAITATSFQTFIDTY